MKKRAKTPAATQKPAKASLAQQEKLPLIDHLKELRRRLFIVAAVVAVGAAATYGLEHQIIDILLAPSHGQDFIYTSPMGGMNFLFSICLDVGLVLATPVIIYQILAFVQPLMRNTSRRFLLLASGATGLVAILGVLFGYYIGLPQALHFLLHQFTTIQVKPLITIQSYIQFVGMYLLGSALIFQLPLIVLFINRIKPLKPGMLLKYERHVIVGAVIIAFVMNPSPNIVDQLLVIIPMIVTYQLSIGLIWLVNRGRPANEHLERLRAQDTARRAERTSRQLIPIPDEHPLNPADMLYDEQSVTTDVVPAYQSTEAAAPAEATVQPDTTKPEVPEPNPVRVVTPAPAGRYYARPIMGGTRPTYLPLRGSIIQ